MSTVNNVNKAYSSDQGHVYLLKLGLVNRYKCILIVVNHGICWTSVQYLTLDEAKIKNSQDKQGNTPYSKIHFNILLLVFKLTLLASFLKLKNQKKIFILNEARRTNLNANKRRLKLYLFWNKV